eukprot:TRINITY_DN7635_c0_g2_i1.p5 TRINITY_DN7635_c0_g2~~TRINITY_DN7635_c0_g2_i1.p5  ORF type:complete len:119 (-),score=5.58 TRINITY_DN7635_c0_g2_i1:1048-1404(-)
MNYYINLFTVEQWPDFGCEGIKVQRAHQPTSQCQGKKKLIKQFFWKEQPIQQQFLCLVYYEFLVKRQIFFGVLVHIFYLHFLFLFWNWTQVKITECSRNKNMLNICFKSASRKLQCRH